MPVPAVEAASSSGLVQDTPAAVVETVAPATELAILALNWRFWQDTASMKQECWTLCPIGMRWEIDRCAGCFSPATAVSSEQSAGTPMLSAISEWFIL
jgi:hypothetical protein